MATIERARGFKRRVQLKEGATEKVNIKLTVTHRTNGGLAGGERKNGKGKESTCFARGAGSKEEI